MRTRRHTAALALAAVLVAMQIQIAAPANAAPDPHGTAAFAGPHAIAGPHAVVGVAGVADRATTPLDALIPTAGSLSTLAAGLPPDPVAAAESLVGTIFGGDDVAAVAATGELLRRAGLPLVSASGPVVALPAGATVVSDPIDVEQLPALTRAIRDGTEFTVQQVSDTLSHIGVTTAPLPPPLMVAALAVWGKDAAAPRESAFAGAAVRSLAGARGQLLVPSAMVDGATLTAMAQDPGSLTQQQLAVLAAPGRLSGLDPLQFILLVAHASGRVVGTVTAVPASPSAPGLRRPAAAIGPAGVAAPAGSVGVAAPAASAGSVRSAASAASGCDTLKDMPDSGKAVVKKQLRGAIKTAVTVATETQNFEGHGGYVDEAFNAYDKGTDVVATTMLLLGATIDLVASPAATHFRHESGDPSRDVWFVANAAFDAPIAAEHLACWSLAGVDLPPNGPLNGFRVRWEIFGSLPMLQTKSEDSDKLLHGELTNQGVSTLKMYPRTETHPPKPGEHVEQHTTSEIVVASLDKDDFPFKLTDLLGIADAEGTALGKAWDIGVAWMQKVGLPSKRIRYPVSYHANSPYVITAHTTMQIPGFAGVVMDADLYSCDGAAGPWRGTVTLTGDAQAILIAVGQAVGADTSKTSGAVDFPMKFTLEPKASQPQKIPFGKGLGLVITLDPDAIDSQENPQSLNDTWDRLRYGAVVGDGSFTSGGIDLREVAGTTAGGLIQGAEYQVVGVIRDARCPGASYWDDRFDSD